VRVRVRVRESDRVVPRRTILSGTFTHSTCGDECVCCILRSDAIGMTDTNDVGEMRKQVLVWNVAVVVVLFVCHAIPADCRAQAAARGGQGAREEGRVGSGQVRVTFVSS
jgi:hypothetical protein